MAKHLVVIYGPPFSGKTAVAWEVARAMAGKTAVVSTDQLLRGAIAVSDANEIAELDMAHTQLRLLVANYLKNGYHVVVEGSFAFDRGGVVLSYEAEIDQLIALMRMLTLRPLTVRLSASDAVLRDRSRSAGRPDEAETAVKISAAYKPRSGPGFRSFNTGAHGASEIGAAVVRDLASAAAGGQHG